VGMGVDDNLRRDRRSVVERLETISTASSLSSVGASVAGGEAGGEMCAVGGAILDLRGDRVPLAGERGDVNAGQQAISHPAALMAMAQVIGAISLHQAAP